jgi:TonB family protein
MTALTNSLSSALLHFLWQGVLVAFALWVALFFLRKRSANARYVVCCSALALMALLPAVTTAVLYRPAAPPVPAIETARALLPGNALPSPIPVVSAQWLSSLRSYALPVWCVGVLLLSFRMVWGCLQISRIRRRGAMPDQGLRALAASLARQVGISRAVRILIAADGESPSVVGWMRPVILVPAAALLNLTADQLEAVLAHELAHIRRHDYLVNLLQVLVETLLFYHPAVWWVSARIRHERELCCDDLAVRCCGDAVCYARALTRLERLRISAPALAMGSNSGSMLYRIQRVLGSTAEEYAPSKLPAVLALVLALACFGLDLQRARGQEGNAHAFTVSSVPGVSIDLGGATPAGRIRAVEYPGYARERGIEGTVTAELTLNADGAVTDARIVSGPAELRKSVLQGVLNWRFDKSYANAMLQTRVKFDHAAAAAAEQTLSQEQQANEQRALAEVQAQIAQFKEQYQGKLLENRRAEAEAGTQEAKAALAGAEQRYMELMEAQRQRTNEELERNSESERAARHELEAKMRASEAEIERGREQMASPEALAAAQKGQLELEIQRQVALSLLQEHSQSLAGRTLRSIYIIGKVMTSAVARIGVQVGDTLTEDTMEHVTQAIKGVDPTLEVRFVPYGENQVNLRISAPGVQK